MKKILLLLFLCANSFAQISMNPLQKYMKRVEYVFDTIQVDKLHQILVICGDSVLINLPDTAMLNDDWGNYQKAGYGYQPDDYQYNLDIRFNGVGTVFLSDSLYVRVTIPKDTATIYTVYVSKSLTPVHALRFFQSVDRERLWIQYVPNTNKFYIYRKEEL